MTEIEDLGDATEAEVAEPAPQPSGTDRAAQALAEGYRSVGTGTLMMVISTICLFAFNFVGRVATARALPVAEFGEFNIGVSFTSLLSVVILLGLNQSVARSLAFEKDPAEQRTIIRWSMLVSGTVSIIASVGVFLLAPQIASLFSDPGLVGVFELLAVSVGFGAITPILGAVFQGFHNVFPNSLWNQIVNPALFAVFVLLLLYFGLGLTGALIAYVVADAVGFVGLLLYYYRRLDRHLERKGPVNPRPNPMLWKLAVSLWGVASLAFITAYADTLILGAYWPSVPGAVGSVANGQVGYYSTAMTLARVVLLGGSALTFIFLPVASRLAREQAWTALRTVYVTAARWIMILTVPLFLLLACLPQATIVAIFGAKYLPAAVPLQILAITAFVSTIVGPVNACLAGLGQARNQLITGLISGGTNIALSFTLIPKYGMLGAAISWGIARALYPLLGITTLYRLYGIHAFRPILVRPLTLTLGIGVPLFLVLRFLTWPAWYIFPLFFLGCGIFILSLLATRSLAPGDLTFVSAFERFAGRPLPKLRSYLERFVAPPLPETAGA
jgi:O-antigen/teichoic acid export membrane protein